MKIAISSCPNDTFIFDAWINKRIDSNHLLDVTYADIDVTNHLAMTSNEFDLLKISFASLPNVLDEYRLLPCGGAIGRGCGPLLLTSNRSKSMNLSGKRIAVPSENSTAYLLFRLWASENVQGNVKEMIVMPFQEIMPAIQDHTIDVGLVIHEGRFVYSKKQLSMLVDLGEWWEKKTHLPIPLGAIIARHSLNLDDLSDTIRRSLLFAIQNQNVTERFVLKHSQELSLNVVRAHIHLYVNEFTKDIGKEGYKAIKTLLTLAGQEGLVPKMNMKKITFY